MRREQGTAVERDLREDRRGERIQGDGGYTERATAWLTAPEFSENHRPLYLERDERAGGREGEHKSIEASLDRLKRMGLIEKDRSIDVRWLKDKEERGDVARSSVLMRLIVVDRALDSDDVPDSALDLAVLKHLALIKTGFLAEPMRRDKEVKDALSRYPGFDGTIEWMEDHGISLERNGAKAPTNALIVIIIGIVFVLNDNPSSLQKMIEFVVDSLGDE